MSAYAMWKMLHLLHMYGPALSRSAIRKLGITCDADTIFPLVSSGAVEALPADGPWEKANEYRISKTAIGIIQNCLVANRREVWTDLRVDEPRVFVIMPFSERWSRSVYSKMIRPAVIDAGLECIRGDSILRTGDLTANILRELFNVGIAVADVTTPNPNVFYEIGLCHSIGKDALLLKQVGTTLPADLGGAHYYEYSTDKVDAGRKKLTKALKAWSASNRVGQVRALGTR
jgi:hypothetical protein